MALVQWFSGFLFFCCANPENLLGILSPHAVLKMKKTGVLEDTGVETRVKRIKRSKSEVGR